MEFPTFEKNANRPTTPVTITPPAVVSPDTRPMEQRLVDQQWRDAERLGLGRNHPLSLNRDADPVA